MIKKHLLKIMPDKTDWKSYVNEIYWQDDALQTILHIITRLYPLVKSRIMLKQIRILKLERLNPLSKQLIQSRTIYFEGTYEGQLYKSNVDEHFK